MEKISGLDREIFPLNLGGNTFGWTSDEAASHAVLDAFVEAGGNFVGQVPGSGVAILR